MSAMYALTAGQSLSRSRLNFRIRAGDLPGLLVDAHHREAGRALAHLGDPVAVVLEHRGHLTLELDALGLREGAAVGAAKDAGLRLGCQVREDDHVSGDAEVAKPPGHGLGATGRGLPPPMPGPSPSADEAASTRDATCAGLASCTSASAPNSAASIFANPPRRIHEGVLGRGGDDRDPDRIGGRAPWGPVVGGLDLGSAIGLGLLLGLHLGDLGGVPLQRTLPSSVILQTPS